MNLRRSHFFTNYNYACSLGKLVTKKSLNPVCTFAECCKLQPAACGLRTADCSEQTSCSILSNGFRILYPSPCLLCQHPAQSQQYTLRIQFACSSAASLVNSHLSSVVVLMDIEGVGGDTVPGEDRNEQPLQEISKAEQRAITKKVAKSSWVWNYVYQLANGPIEKSGHVCKICYDNIDVDNAPMRVFQKCLISLYNGATSNRESHLKMHLKNVVPKAQDKKLKVVNSFNISQSELEMMSMSVSLARGTMPSTTKFMLPCWLSIADCHCHSPLIPNRLPSLSLQVT